MTGSAKCCGVTRKCRCRNCSTNSINSTLSRSIITHVTVTLALLALLLFGGHAIHSFTAVMMFGVVLVGTYTSIFIAAPILIYLGVGTTGPTRRTSRPKKK